MHHTPNEVFYPETEDDEDLILEFKADEVVELFINHLYNEILTPKFTSGQLYALLAGLQFLGSLPNGENSAAIESALKKLAASSKHIPASAIEFRGTNQPAGARILANAIENQKRIRCTYTNGNHQTSVREMDPLRIYPNESAWQLASWCYNHNEVRYFRVENITEVEILDEPWGAEAKAAELEGAMKYQAHDTDVKVVVEADPEGYSLIFDHFGTLGRPDPRTRVVRAELSIGNPDAFGRKVATYGGAVRVISPEQVRRIVSDYAKAALGEKPKPQVTE